MAPVLVRGHFRAIALPIDGGRTIGGKPILGSHKTWRGLVVGAIAGVFVFELQRFAYHFGWWRELASFDYSLHPVAPGLLMGIGAIIGDAVKSFFKRRVGIAPG